MKLTFAHDWLLENSMVFEEEYNDNIKLDLTDKNKLKGQGAEFIYLIDSELLELIGETYFIEVNKLEENLPGLSEWRDKKAVYVYSTTILTKFQNKGFGKILKAYFLGYIKNKYDFVLGHAKEMASIEMNKNFGAEIIKEEKNWQDTNETFYFYKIAI
jgi:hypothetical protein